MINVKWIFLTSILAMLYGNVFALDNHLINCNFPQHFTIDGPSHTHIINVQAGTESDFIVTKNSYNSFDVIDKTHCQGKGINSVRLKVGIDESHFSEVAFADNRDGKITIFTSSEFNGFHLEKINNISKSDVQLVYIIN